MTVELAVVETVAIRSSSTFTLAGYAAGATTLRVDDMSCCRESGGGRLLVGAGDAAPIVGYSSAYVDDDGAEWIELEAPGLPADIVTRTSLYPYPTRRRKEAQVWHADDPLRQLFPAYVEDPALWADSALGEGTGLAVPVKISKAGHVWHVVGMDHRGPSIDARHVTAATLQPEAVDVPSWTGKGTTTDLLAGEVPAHPRLTLVGANIETAPAGSGVQVTRMRGDQGFVIVDEDGKVLLQVLAEAGSRPHITGLVDADSGSYGTVAVKEQADMLPGSRLNFSRQFPAPAQGPLTSRYWASLPVPDLVDPSNTGGLLRFDGAWWTVTGPDATSYVTQIADDGTLDLLHRLPDDLYAGNGLTRIDDLFYVGGFTPDLTNVILTVDDTGAVGNARIGYSRVSSSPSVPVIGSAGGDLLVADIRPDGHVIVTTIDPVTGLSSGSPDVLPVLEASTKILSGVELGAFDFGEECYVIWCIGQNDRQVLVVPTADLSAWDTDRAFGFANDESPAAGCWADDVTRFAGLGLSSAIWTHANAGMDGLNLHFKTAQTLVNETEGYETDLSGQWTKIKLARRGGLRFNTSTLPGTGGAADPEFTRVYFTQGDGLSLSSWSLAGDADPTSGELIMQDVAVTFEGAPAGNTFPDGPYAVITRDGTDDVLVFGGDGTFTGELLDYIEALIAASSGGGGGGIGGVGGGHWGDVYGSFGVKGGTW